MKFYNFLLTGFIVAALVSCDKNEEETALTISDFVGSWNATSAVFTDNSNSNNIIDFIQIGGEIRFTMLDHGGVRTWVDLDTFSDEWDSQAVLTNSSILTMTPTEATRSVITYEFILDDNILTLTNRNANFDFSLSGAAEVPATLVTTLVRN
jgi:hypothetical protein